MQLLVCTANMAVLSSEQKVHSVGFEPTPTKNTTWTYRLRPLGHECTCCCGSHSLKYKQLFKCLYWAARQPTTTPDKPNATNLQEPCALRNNEQWREEINVNRPEPRIRLSFKKRVSPRYVDGRSELTTCLYQKMVSVFDGARLGHSALFLIIQLIGVPMPGLCDANVCVCVMCVLCNDSLIKDRVEWVR